MPAPAGAVQLRNELANSLGVALPPTVTFDYPTPASLASFIAGQAAIMELEDATLIAPVPRSMSLPLAAAASVTALVGLSCAYPCSAVADGPSGFWRAAAAGADLPTTIPYDRWDIEQHYAPDIAGEQLC